MALSSRTSEIWIFNERVFKYTFEIYIAIVYLIRCKSNYKIKFNISHSFYIKHEISLEIVNAHSHSLQVIRARIDTT